MARREIAKEDWMSIDVDTMAAQDKAAYSKYIASRKIAQNDCDAFETGFASRLDVPKGMEVVFSHRFGMLSIAFAPIANGTTKRGKVSFAALAKKNGK